MKLSAANNQHTCLDPARMNGENDEIRVFLGLLVRLIETRDVKNENT
jgi:hypothetical protein